MIHWRIYASPGLSGLNYERAFKCKSHTLWISNYSPKDDATSWNNKFSLKPKGRSWYRIGPKLPALLWFWHASGWAQHWNGSVAWWLPLSSLEFRVAQHWNGKIMWMTAPVLIGDVKDKLQRPQWRPGQSLWQPFRFCECVVSIRGRGSLVGPISYIDQVNLGY